jgi:hypothetical protein
MRLSGIFLWLLCCGVAAAQLTPEIEARDAVIREKSQALFEVLPLAYDAEGRAPFHVVDPDTRSFDYEGSRYFGFRFQTPSTIEGDFWWIFLLKPKDGPVTVDRMGWYILRKAGPMTGFANFRRQLVENFPEVRAQFPYTRNITVQTLDAENFLPNEEYIIWFCYPEKEPKPQIAVAFSFALPGTSWMARLPLGTKKVAPTATTPTSLEGDPW